MNSLALRTVFLPNDINVYTIIWTHNIDAMKMHGHKLNGNYIRLLRLEQFLEATLDKIIFFGH